MAKGRTRIRGFGEPCLSGRHILSRESVVYFPGVPKRPNCARCERFYLENFPDKFFEVRESYLRWGNSYEEWNNRLRTYIKDILHVTESEVDF